MNEAAFDQYVAQIRAGSTDLYPAYRVYEHAYRLRGADREIARRSALLLLEGDPWFLVGAMPYFVDCLRTSDVDRVLPRVGAGLNAAVRAQLQARLVYFTAPRYKRPNRTRLTAVRTRLLRVPASHRDAEWYRMLADTQLRLGDWLGYKRGFKAQYDAAACAWRTSIVRDGLRAAAKHRDWKSFDEWRPLWDEQPPSANYCECSKHEVATCDGHRAIAAGHWDEASADLVRSAAVDGCPHLNSGGLDLSLVRKLIARKVYRPACRAFLERARSFGNTKAIDVLEKRLL